MMVPLAPQLRSALTENLEICLKQLRGLGIECSAGTELIGFLAKPAHCEINLDAVRIDRPYWDMCRPKVSLKEREACWREVCALTVSFDRAAMFAVDPMLSTVRIPELMAAYTGRNMGYGIYEIESLDEFGCAEVIDAVSHAWGGGIVQLNRLGAVVAYTTVVFDDYAPAMLLHKDMALNVIEAGE